MIFKLLYGVGIRLYGAAIVLFSLWNAKAAKWYKGRKGQDIGALEKFSQSIWFHCASVGEFEQARPLIELIRKRTAEKIVLSFFSPSGYEMHRNYSNVDAVFYLPLDTKQSMKRLVSVLNPKVFVLVKYELWVNLLMELNNKKIPLVMVSARFRESHFIFKPWAGIYRQVLKSFEHIFVQDAKSEELLRSFAITRVSVAGDTRFDRVLAVASSSNGPDIGKASKPLIVAGSTWPEDDDLLLKAMLTHRSQFQLVIVPHELHENHIGKLLANKALRVGRYTTGSRLNEDLDVLVFDVVGALSYVYRKAYIAYVGGGFGKGIHNLLEPAVYGLPVVFGPNNKKFIEAQELQNLGVGIEVRKPIEVSNALSSLLSAELHEALSMKAKAYILESAGASEKCSLLIMSLLK